MRIVSTAPFLRFGCTTAALATNPPIECPTRITLVGRILPLSSFCCDLIPTEFLYRSRICHNESLSILNKTILLPVLVAGSKYDKRLLKNSTQFQHHETAGKNMKEHTGMQRVPGEQLALHIPHAL